MKNLHSIFTRDHELISDRVSLEEIHRLCGLTEDGRALDYGAPSRLFPDGEPILGPRLIVAHPKKPFRWKVIAGVDPAVIRAELRRKMSNRLPVAEDNQTVKREPFSNAKGSGMYFEPRFEVCFGYRTTAACLAEKIGRHQRRVSSRVVAPTERLARAA